MSATGDFDLAEFQAYAEDDELEEKEAPAAIDDDTFRSVHAAGFREFLLKPELLRAIEAAGLEHPSAVQAQSIPQGILGTDVLIQAKAGQGKTLSFVIPILQQLEVVEGQISAVVLVHTRELAYQIFAEFGRFSKFMPEIKASVFYGGVPAKEHREALKTETPNIIIGTPGRMKQLSVDGSFKLDHVKYFVIDECDSVLSQIDMRADIQEIYRRTPHEKQVIMCSATLSDEVKEVIKKFMHNPLEVLVSERSNLTLHGLQQYYVELQEGEKNRKLVDLLDSLDFNQVVIFVSSGKRADELNKLLIDCNFPSEVIHGRINQPERIARYKKFKSFNTRILVATNLFGRGVDVAKVNLVIQYDMATANKRRLTAGEEPTSTTEQEAIEDGADSYLHRVGRAGRFGTRGLAISFISSPEDSAVLNAVQERFKVSIEALPDKVDPSTYMNV